jgi:hypothetical protein
MFFYRKWDKRMNYSACLMPKMADGNKNTAPGSPQKMK